jgi:hypothetical protein
MIKASKERISSLEETVSAFSDVLFPLVPPESTKALQRIQ